MTFNTEIFDRIFAKEKMFNYLNFFSKLWYFWYQIISRYMYYLWYRKWCKTEEQNPWCIVLACVLGPSIIIIQTFCTLKIKLFFFRSKIHSEWAVTCDGHFSCWYNEVHAWIQRKKTSKVAVLLRTSSWHIAKHFFRGSQF